MTVSVHYSSAVSINITHFLVTPEVVQAEIAKTQREILELLQQQTTVTMHQQVLEDPKRHVDAIAIKLDAVVMIWQTVNALLLDGPQLPVDEGAISLDQFGHVCPAQRLIKKPGRRRSRYISEPYGRNSQCEAQLTSQQFYIVKMKVAKEIYGKLSWMLERYVEEMRAVL